MHCCVPAQVLRWSRRLLGCPCSPRVPPPPGATSAADAAGVGPRLVRATFTVQLVRTGTVVLRTAANCAAACGSNLLGQPVADFLPSRRHPPLAHYCHTVAWLPPGLSHHEHQRPARRRSTLLLLFLPRRLRLHCRPPIVAITALSSQRQTSRAAAAAAEAFGPAIGHPPSHAYSRLLSATLLCVSAPVDPSPARNTTHLRHRRPLERLDSSLANHPPRHPSSPRPPYHHLPPLHRHLAAFSWRRSTCLCHRYSASYRVSNCLPPVGTRHTATPEAYQARRRLAPTTTSSLHPPATRAQALKCTSLAIASALPRALRGFDRAVSRTRISLSDDDSLDQLALIPPLSPSSTQHEGSQL